MKYVLSLCFVLAMSIAAYGQQPGVDVRLTAPQEPDPTGQRLQYLRESACALEQTGNHEQAAAIRRQAEVEEQSLLQRLNALQAEAEQIRQAIGTNASVMVKIQMVEVSLTKLKRLGIDCDKLTGKDQPFSAANDNGYVLQILESVRKDNLAKNLGSPVLTTQSGRPATLHSGSEFSVPIPQPDGSVKMERQHGLEIQVTPEVLGDKVRLAFQACLAEPDYGHTVRVGNADVPGVKRFDVSCSRAEIKSGETLVCHGPIDVHEVVENRGVPYLSELPYIGVTFRKVTATRNETMIFVLVQPEIMQPSAKAIPPTGLK